MEIKLLLTLDLREQAALQAALVTHGAPDALVTLALTRLPHFLHRRGASTSKWLAEARTAGDTGFRFPACHRAGANRLRSLTSLTFLV